MKTKSKLPVYRPLTRLSELEKVCSAPLVVEAFVGRYPDDLDAVRFTFAGRRLTPDESRKLRLILESSLPPELPPEKEGGEARYDFRNPAYLERREATRRHARALALYWAFPIFRDLDRPPDPPITETEIIKRIENSSVDESVLELAYGLVTREIVGVDPKRVGFTFGNSNPPA